jgi:hypothetical protein
MHAATSTALSVTDGMPIHFRYVTIDVHTSPPTQVAIVRSDADAAIIQRHDPNVYVLSVEDMLPTKGWADAIEQVSAAPDGYLATTGETLNICFLHAFGRCRGKANGGPSTCQQLHVRLDVLWPLRALYRQPVRPFFVRVFSATLPPSLQAAIAAAGALAPSHLNYAAEDVPITAGTRRVDFDFRTQLTSPDRCHAPLRARDVPLCVAFAVGVPCVFAEACECLHAPLDATVSALRHGDRAALTTASRNVRTQMLFYSGGLPLPPPPPPLSPHEPPTQPEGRPSARHMLAPPNTPEAPTAGPAGEVPWRTPTAHGSGRLSLNKSLSTDCDGTRLLSDLSTFLQHRVDTSCTVIG